jgi:hypothetical protein
MGEKSPANQRPAKLMHRHGNPNGDIGQTLRCNTPNLALQYSVANDSGQL